MTGHLSAPPSSTSGSDLLGVGKTENAGGGSRLINNKTSSNACCAVFAIDAIFRGENQVDVLDAINNIHPLVNLKEISFMSYVMRDYLHHTRLSQDPFRTQLYRHQMQCVMSFYEIFLVVHTMYRST